MDLLKNPKASISEICKIIKGPDFPTEAELITSKEEIFEIYKTGKGTLKSRAKYVKENGELVINSLPFQVSGGEVLCSHPSIKIFH